MKQQNSGDTGKRIKIITTEHQKTRISWTVAMKQSQGEPKM